MIQRQKTIKESIFLKGIGLHTGCQAEVCLKPADENSGIQFIRTDLPHKPIIKTHVDNISVDPMPRCTTLGRGEEAIHTVEHLMAILSGLEISNLTIEINGRELPGLDGGGLEFLKAIKKVGIVEQQTALEVFEVKEPIGVSHQGASIYIVPSSELRISYALSYDHPFLKSQFFSSVITPDIFEKELAASRTFCLESEAEELRKSGLGQGANHNNTLVVGRNGVMDNELRFPDEFVRHKVLDFLGDLYLLGQPIRGHVFAIKSGHRLNLELLKKIVEQKAKYEKASRVPYVLPVGQKEINIEGIMKILPHRYPFLLVDRVIELEQGKRAIGIKNVTMNEDFFRGHFPTRPIMPGVLMVEAMAQVAGVVVLTSLEHHGKVAFFMAVDKVKFRKVVVPGDQLVMEVEVVRDRARTTQVHAQAKVDGEVVVEADMMFSFTDDSYLDEN